MILVMCEIKIVGVMMVNPASHASTNTVHHVPCILICDYHFIDFIFAANTGSVTDRQIHYFITSAICAVRDSHQGAL